MSAQDAMDLARSELIATVQQNGTAAISEYLGKLGSMDFPFELSPRDIAEIIVDGECARGDYEGCSPELELAFEHYCALAKKALEGAQHESSHII